MKTNFITQIITITLSLTLLSDTLSCKSSTNKKTPADPAPELFFDLSLAQWSLHKTIRSGTMSPYDFAKVASEFGFKGLEYVNGLYPDVMNSENKTTALQAFVEKNKALAKQYNVKNVLIMIDEEGDLSSSEEQERMTAIENHKLWIDAAHQMGCTAVRLNLHGEKEEAKWIKNSIESLSALSEYAAPFNINVIVENHGGKSSNANLLMQVINQVNFSNCGTLPDFGNFCMSENWGSLKDNKCNDLYAPYLGVSEMLPKAFGVSAKSYEFDANGDETILDYYKLLSIVKKGGYDGFIGVEYEGEVLSEKEGILATKRLLEKVAASL